MFKRIKILFLSAGVILIFTTCKKYPDDDKFPWQTVDKRMEGTYILDKYVVNNIDSTYLIPPCNVRKSLPYTVADGHYYFKFKPFNSDGRKYVDGLDNVSELGDQWSFYTAKAGVWLSYNSGQNYVPPFTKGRNILEPDWNGEGSWVIRKLTDKEMWLKTTIGNLTFEVHLTKVHFT